MVAALGSYQLRLPTFEGPLDVLLRLIEREQLSISEVSLLSVYDQYMEFTGYIAETNLEATAEFAVVAGRLSVLKSRALLPRPSEPADDADDIDLVRQLEEYRIVQLAAAALADSMKRDEVSFERGNTAPLPGPSRLHLLPQPPIDLAKAVDRWQTRRRPVSIPLPRLRVVSLREMLVRIGSILDRTSRTTFASCCATCSHRQEVVVTFLALLTLLRRRVITADQGELFGPIAITRSRFDAHATTGVKTPL